MGKTKELLLVRSNGHRGVFFPPPIMDKQNRDNEISRNTDTIGDTHGKNMLTGNSSSQT